MVIGVGLMGQDMASHIISWMGLQKLVLVDHADSIKVGTESMLLADYAAQLCKGSDAEVVAETVNITSEEDVASLFADILVSTTFNIRPASRPNRSPPRSK